MADDLEMRAALIEIRQLLEYAASEGLHLDEDKLHILDLTRAALSLPKPSDAGDARDAARWRFVESELRRVLWTGSHYQYTIYLASPNREIEDPGAMVDAALAARQASPQPLEAGKVEPVGEMIGHHRVGVGEMPTISWADGYWPTVGTKFYAAPTGGAQAGEALQKFLDAAAGEGLVLNGIDAADLYAATFPERYAAATKEPK